MTDDKFYLLFSICCSLFPVLYLPITMNTDPRLITCDITVEYFVSNGGSKLIWMLHFPDLQPFPRR